MPIIERRSPAGGGSTCLLLDSVGSLDRPAAEPALHEVDAAAPQARERRAQVAKELRTVSTGPGEPEQRQQCLAERRLRQARRRVDRIRDPEGRERRRERRAPALLRRDDDADLVGRDPVAEQLEDRLAHELERATGSGPLEEPDRSLQRRRVALRAAEQAALEVGEGGVRDLGVARTELRERAVGEAGELRRGLGQPLERRPAGLVRERHRDVRAPGERADQRPLGLGQIFEAVREDRMPLPGVQLIGHAVGRGRPKLVTIPEAEPVELLAVRGVQAGKRPLELLGRDETGFDLADCVAQRVREACGARRLPEAVEGRLRDRSPERERLLDVRGDRSRVGIAGRDPLEDAVERRDRAAEERRRAAQELPLGPVDVRAVRHDEDRVLVERGQVPIEQQLDFARVRRPGEQRQPHRPIVDLP